MGNASSLTLWWIVLGITIGSNSASLQAQRSLATASDALARSFERLASGQRINRASDDAAGISIADRLKSDSILQTQAIKNINDGLSALAIADATLQSQVTVIQRMSELAAQAANETYSASQREALSNEFIELRKELGRIAEATTFNGQELLSSQNAISGSRLSLQVGINAASDSLIYLPSLSSGALTGSIDVSLMRTYALGGEFIDLTVGSSYESMLALIERVEAGGEALGSQMQLIHVPTTLPNGEGKDYFYLMTGWGGAGGLATGILFEKNADGSLTETQAYVELAISAEGDSITSEVGLLDGGTLDLRSLRFSVGGLSSDGTFLNDSSFTNLEALGIESASRSRVALEVTSNRIQELGNLRGAIGAVESRLGGALAVLNVQRENFLAAESRIRDVDVAQEAGLVAARAIMQQVAASVLGQANQQPALALQLL